MRFACERVGGLDVGDIHIDDGFVLVRGKGSKERLSPLVGSAARALMLYVTEGRSRLAAHARGTETFGGLFK